MQPPMYARTRVQYTPGTMPTGEWWAPKPLSDNLTDRLGSQQPTMGIEQAWISIRTSCNINILQRDILIHVRQKWPMDITPTRGPPRSISFRQRLETPDAQQKAGAPGKRRVAEASPVDRPFDQDFRKPIFMVTRLIWSMDIYGIRGMYPSQFGGIAGYCWHWEMSAMTEFLF